MKTLILQNLNLKKEVQVFVTHTKRAESAYADFGFFVLIAVGTSALLRALSLWLGPEEIKIQKAPGILVTREQEYRHLNNPNSFFRIN